VFISCRSTAAPTDAAAGGPDLPGAVFMSSDSDRGGVAFPGGPARSISSA
jgi:hypothetical protein